MEERQFSITDHRQHDLEPQHAVSFLISSNTSQIYEITNKLAVQLYKFALESGFEVDEQ